MSDWISVKDKLPSNEGVYKIKYETFRHGCLVDSGECDEKLLSHGMFEMTDAEDNGEEYRRITHWAPLSHAAKDYQKQT